MTSSHWQRINYADQHVQRLARCLSYIIFLAFANGENRTHNLFVLSAPSQMIVSQVAFLLFVTLSSSTTDCTVILRSCGRSCFSLQSPVTNWRRLEVYSNITTQFMYYYYIFHNFLAWDQSSKSIYLFSMIVLAIQRKRLTHEKELFDFLTRPKGCRLVPLTLTNRFLFFFLQCPSCFNKALSSCSLSHLRFILKHLPRFSVQKFS